MRGGTTTAAVRALHFAITHPNVSVIVIAPSMRQSRNLRERMELLINAIPQPLRRLIFRKARRDAIHLRNGSVIKFLPNSPDLVRGETADMIVVDEFAMFREDRYLLNSVLQPMLAARERLGTGYLIVMSTPKNKRSMFYKLCQPNSGFSHHHVTWREAVAAGLIRREFIEEQRRRLLPAEFQTEYEAEFIDDADSWLPYDLISRCINALLEPYHFEDTPQGEFYVGVDLGKYQDYSVVAVVQREGQVLKLVHLHRFPLRTPYASVIGYVKALCGRYRVVRAVLVDQTGVGEYVVEDMQNAGVPGVRGVKLTMPMKEEVMVFLKQKMLNQKLQIYYDPQLIAELNVERFEVTRDGRLRFSHPAGTHDDTLWALALAVYATKREVGGAVILF